MRMRALGKQKEVKTITADHSQRITDINIYKKYKLNTIEILFAHIILTQSQIIFNLF